MISLDLDFMLALDARNHPRFPTGMVEFYERNWWTHDEVPADSLVISDIRVLYPCLIAHREQLQRATAPTRTPATSHHSAPPLATAASSRSPFPPPRPNTELDCKRCTLYRQAALDAIRIAKFRRHQLSSKESLFEEQQLLTMRRSSGFNRLFEYALLKEKSSETVPLASAPPPSAPQPSAPTRQMRERKTPNPRPIQQRKLTNIQLANILREHAEAKHQQLTQDPALKWTWGMDVNTTDIQELFRAGDNDYVLPHSGYDASLPEGRFPGEHTASQPSLPDISSGVRYSRIGSSITTVPDIASNTNQVCDDSVSGTRITDSKESASAVDALLALTNAAHSPANLMSARDADNHVDPATMLDDNALERSTSPADTRHAVRDEAMSDDGTLFALANALNALDDDCLADSSTSAADALAALANDDNASTGSKDDPAEWSAADALDALANDEDDQEFSISPGDAHRLLLSDAEHSLSHVYDVGGNSGQRRWTAADFTDALVPDTFVDYESGSDEEL